MLVSVIIFWCVRKMNIKKLQKKLNKRFPAFSVREEDGCRFVTGESDNWDEIVRACSMCVSKDKNVHVVNDVVFTGKPDTPMRVPAQVDSSLDGKEIDVLVIGGGISGATILRELSRWNVKALLVDKEADLAMHASGRNDGEIHPGVDLAKGSLKQHYVLLGNQMFPALSDELDVPFDRCGQYACFTQGALKGFVTLYALKRKYIDGCRETYILSGRKLRKKEPNLNKQFKFALYNPTAGCICPYGLTIACAENAVQNGAEVSLNTAVLGMTTENGKITAVQTNRGTLFPKIVINAAGVFSEEIAKMANDRFYSIHPRRGTNSILDRKAGSLLSGIASVKVLELNSGHTKGGGLLHTVHGNILAGPDAVETNEKENFATTPESINTVFTKQKVTAPDLTERDIITYFTGVRAPDFEEDFVIEKGRKTKNLIHCAAIQSPGLTTAPAVARDVSRMAIDMLQAEKLVLRNDKFNPNRKAPPRLAEMSVSQRNRIIKENPAYGEIVCRCEEISKGEILDALNAPICVPTVDGIKKRVRPGMGRCQGGFCSPLVAQIIAEHQGIELEEVTKSGEKAFMLFGKTKGGDAL